MAGIYGQPVFVFVLVIVRRLSSELVCDTQEPCFGLRPRLNNGCCPLLGGEKCVQNKLNECDTELGYSCINGRCSGRYNLTVVQVGDSSLTLALSPYQTQENIRYLVLYSTSLQDLPTGSSSHKVGNHSSITLQFLLPATWYYIQVAAWDVDHPTNLSEVVVVKTKARRYCLFNGRHISVGETLTVECEDACLCTDAGTLQCVPVCSPNHPDTQQCQRDGPRTNCCQYVSNCSSVSCNYDGHSVPHGHNWVIDCAENCTCRHGIFMCTPLCNKIIVPKNCTEKILIKTADGCCENYICKNTESAVTHSVPRYDTLSAAATLTVTNKTHDSATVTWSIPEPIMYKISSFVIKYKRLADTDWRYTPRLIFTERSYRLNCLHHLSWHDVHLYSYPGNRRLAASVFRTTEIKETFVKEFVPQFVNVTIESNSVILLWEQVPTKHQHNVSHIEILWSPGSHGDYVFKACMPAFRETYTISDLKPASMYTIWLGVCLLDDSVVMSDKVHAVTAHLPVSRGHVSRSSLLIALVIACISFAILSVIIVTMFYLFRMRRRASYLTHTEFENRIFQIYNTQQDRES